MKTEEQIRRATYLLADEAGRRNRAGLAGWASRGGMSIALLWALDEEGAPQFDEYVAEAEIAAGNETDGDREA